MRAAVTYEDGKVFGHFGRTPAFKIYDIEDGAVVSSEVADTNGSGHGALAGFLAERNVDVLICGGIGGGAVIAMASAGIRIYAGAEGDTDEVIKAFIDGTLPEVGDANCDHHDHEHGEHECGHGEHGCGGGCHN